MKGAIGSITSGVSCRLAAWGLAAGAHLFVFAGSAHADLLISSAPNQNVHCSASKCSATAANAMLNANRLENMLAAGNVAVSTAQTAGPNIVVNASLTWVSAYSLTIDAYTSVAVNAPVTIAGPGALSIVTNDGGYDGTFSVGDGANITFWSTSNKVAINRIAYKLIDTIASLAAAVKSHPKGYFALSHSYDASADGSYAAAPVGFFQGYFEGFGNTIANLSINARKGSNFIGLFASTDVGGLIENLRLTDINVVARKPGTVGGLVGWGFGSLLNDSVSGKVRAPGDSAAGLLAGSVGAGTVANSRSSGSVKGRVAGGLAGSAIPAADAGISILNSSSMASVMSPKENYTQDQHPEVGGLIGLSKAYIKNSWSSGKVTGGSFAFAGGLVGNLNCGAAVGSFSTGAVSAGDNAAVGGLVGNSVGNPLECDGGAIGASYATGVVRGGANSYDGGLVGECGAALLNDFASGAVTSDQGGYVGGLVGYAVCGMDQVSASGNVAGGSKVGGLVGFNIFSTSDAYATGTVTGEASGDVGGLIGHNVAPITDSYSASKVTGNGAQYVGGLIGEHQASSLSHTYWDMTTSSITNSAQGAGNISNDPGFAGKSDRRLNRGLPRGFSSSIWGQSPQINDGLPYLLGNTFAATHPRSKFQCSAAQAAQFASLCRSEARP